MLATLFILIILIYTALILWLIYGFDKVDEFLLQDLAVKTRFSVVIPFRNEADNLPTLLHSILQLNYPKSHFEIILVDDTSEDESVTIIKDLLATNGFNKAFKLGDNIQIIPNIRNTNSPKKDAISAAIAVSKFEWIITTDADCNVPKYWLDAFDECIQTKNPNCIVAPVTYNGRTSFFNRFQTLDFMSLQGATIGAFGIKLPFLSNGANFGYKKSVFNSINGFEGNAHIASGDDVFLLQKFISQDKNSVQYLKSFKAIVLTKPVTSIKALKEQRLRWASKTTSYDNWFAKGLAVVVLLGNLTCTLFVPFVLLELVSARVALALFVIKFSIDFLLLFKTSRFFRQESLLSSYIFSSIIYPFFNIYIAFLSVFKTYNWKGRNYKK